MTFNFCFQPLLKENILKITIEIEEYLLIKDAVIKAINEFNNQDKEFGLKDDISSYKIKLTKKSGLPDLDLPSKLNILNRCRYKIRYIKYKY